MNINKLAFRDGKDDYLDSTGYFPVFWVFAESGAPVDITDALDSYAMGFEHASAVAALVSERARYLFSMGPLLKNPELSIRNSSLWGNNK
jgi:hypothetical protein